MNQIPLVSVLITAYNRELYIAEAIKSVLASVYTNFEIIVVDDCSTDNTLAIAQEYAEKDKRIKIYSNQENLGQFANRNKAAKLASGKYIKYVDSDDTIYPDCLGYLTELLETNPDCSLAGEFRYCTPLSPEVVLPIVLTSQDTYLWHFEKGGILYVGPSQIIFPAKFFNQIGGFPENMGTNADIMVNLRLAALGNTILFKSGLLYWRRHDKQVAAEQAKNLSLMLKERLNIHRKILNEINCPLTLSQKKRILFSLQVMYIRAAFFYHLFKDGFRVFVKLFSFETVPVYKIPIMLLPLRLLRKYYN